MAYVDGGFFGWRPFAAGVIYGLLLVGALNVRQRWVERRGAGDAEDLPGRK